MLSNCRWNPSSLSRGVPAAVRQVGQHPYCDPLYKHCCFEKVALNSIRCQRLLCPVGVLEGFGGQNSAQFAYVPGIGGRE